MGAEPEDWQRRGLCIDKCAAVPIEIDKSTRNFKKPRGLFVIVIAGKAMSIRLLCRLPSDSQSKLVLSSQISHRKD
jgi:hypothetical protein